MAHWRSSRPSSVDAAAFFLCLLGAVLLWLAAAFLAPAWSHSWYDGACCSGRDCFEVTKKAGTGEVTLTRTGYNVVIRRLPAQLGGAALDPPFQTHVEQANTRRSQDEFPHACLYVVANEAGTGFGLRCLYVPDLGS
jgi:hypothetical protein